MMTKMFKYPEVVHNHFQICHSVDDHNAKRHSPISIEVVSQKSTDFCQNLASPAGSMTV